MSHKPNIARATRAFALAMVAFAAIPACSTMSSVFAKSTKKSPPQTPKLDSVSAPTRMSHPTKFGRR